MQHASLHIANPYHDGACEPIRFYIQPLHPTATTGTLAARAAYLCRNIALRDRLRDAMVGPSIVNGPKQSIRDE